MKKSAEHDRRTTSHRGAPDSPFFILHSSFDILHFGFRARENTEMSNEE